MVYALLCWQQLSFAGKSHTSTGVAVEFGCML